MKRNFLSVLFLIIVCSLQAQTSSSVAPAAKPAGISSERLTRIDNFIQSYIDKGELNGASAIILRNGKIIYYKSFGFANKEKHIAIKKDNIFRIA
ncbi:MAG TPA: serine hydrolase, partial [Chitinophagaceae bacterium]|nr:serine hydrolase [Chitinophagaceae bacterium]